MRLGADVLGLDLYEILGVQRGASPGELRRAYRKRARESHPDLNPNDSSAARRMVYINIAYRVLLDPSLRSTYERKREELKAEARAKQVKEPRHSNKATYSHSDGEWADVPRAEQAGNNGFEDFLRAVRSREARVSLRVLQIVTRAPARRQLVACAACIAVACGLIGFVGLRVPQPTSVDPQMLFP